MHKNERSWPDFASLGQALLQATQDDAASKPPKLPPALYLVATPIGNMGDLSLRALWALSQVDAVLCEDTRVTGGLLHRLGLKKPLISCHDHNEEHRIAEVLARLASGQRLALVSDAGTPLISDPGFRLVRAARAGGHEVVALPGASAVLTALCASGLPASRFLFVGFLPTKSTALKAALAPLSGIEATLVFYENPRRLAATLAALAAAFSPARRAVVARELTKLHEELREGTLAELAAHYADVDAPKGEIVLLVEGGSAAEEALPSEETLEAALRAALQTLSVKDAAAQIAARFDLKKKDAYARALALLPTSSPKTLVHR